jgi:hypothetical protein
MAKEGRTSRKAVRKSDNITGTPARGKMMEVTPNTKEGKQKGTGQSQEIKAG